MGRHILHRLLILLPALVGVLFLCFCLMQVAPADPAVIIAGPDARPEVVAAIRKELGLDRAIPIQFVEYIGRVAGDGRSLVGIGTTCARRGTDSDARRARTRSATPNQVVSPRAVR